MKINYLAFSNVGLVRKNNEDFFVVNNEIHTNERCEGITENNKFIVCDGVGGIKGGEQAAYAAASFLKEQIIDEVSEENIRSVLIELNNHIASLRETDLHGAATTVVGLFVGEQNLVVFNLGDSRAYRYRNGLYFLLSADHGLRNENGEKPKALSNVITHYVGMKDLHPEDINVFDYAYGFLSNDTFVLCSDGVSDLITDDEMKDIIERNDSLNEISEEINKLVYARGARDNFTYILLRKGEN